MPITGQFLADFTDFIRGGQSADKMLGDLEARSGTFGEAWDKSFKRLDFSKLLTNPLGESTRALQNFTTVLGPMGRMAFGVAGGVAAVGSAALALANSTANAAENLGDMADKTGMTVPELSRLQNAAALAGTDIESLSNVAYILQQRIATEPKAFAEGLEKIGLSFQEMKSADPYTLLTSVATALSATEDPQKRITAGNELMGKQYREMAPVLADLGPALEDVADVPVFTAEDAAEAKKFKDEMALLGLELQSIGRSIGSVVIPPLTSLLEYLRKEEWGTFKGFLEGTRQELDLLGAAWQVFSGNTSMALPAVQGAKTGMEGLGNAATLTSQLMIPATQAVADSKEMIKAQDDAMKAAEAEAKKYAAAWAEINTAGSSWGETLRGLSGDTVEAVKYYLEAGVAQDTLKTAYKLSETEIRAIVEALAAEKQAHKDLQDQATARITAMEALYLSYDEAVRASSADSTQARIDDAWRAADAQIMAMAKAGTMTEDAYRLIQKTATTTVDNIIRKTLEQDQYSRAYYEKLATQAQIAYQNAQAHSDQYTANAIENLRLEAETASQTLLNWQAAADAALAKTKGSAEQATEALRTMNSEIRQGTAAGVRQPGVIAQHAGGLPTVNPFTGQGVVGTDPRVLGYLSQGYSLFEAVALAQGHGSRFVAPGGRDQALRAQGVNVNVYGSVLSEKNLADAVGNALTNYQRSGGNRMPV